MPSLFLGKTTGLVLCGLALGAAACRVDAAGTAEKVRVDEEDVNDAIDQARDLAVCGDMTAEELATADAITESCRADIRKLLPPAENNAKDRVLLLSHEVDLDLDTTTLRIEGLDAEGAAISAVAFGTASFSLAGTPEVTLTATVSALGNATENPISIAVANDYSASMLDQDLDRVAAIETDLFRCFVLDRAVTSGETLNVQVEGQSYPVEL